MGCQGNHSQIMSGIEVLIPNRAFVHRLGQASRVFRGSYSVVCCSRVVSPSWATAVRSCRMQDSNQADAEFRGVRAEFRGVKMFSPRYRIRQPLPRPSRHDTPHRACAMSRRGPTDNAITEFSNDSFGWEMDISIRQPAPGTGRRHRFVTKAALD